MDGDLCPSEHPVWPVSMVEGETAMSELTPYSDLIVRLRKWVSYSNGIPSQPEICKEAADALSDCERRIAAAVAQERERCAKVCDAERQNFRDLLDAGRGTWPQPDYVREETWTTWQSGAMTAGGLARAIRAEPKEPK